VRTPHERLGALIEAHERRQRLKWVFFWGHSSPPGNVTKACLSQWYPAPFRVGREEYPTAEHWMMAEKARLFGDDDALKRVFAASHPGEAKRIGREVRGFEEPVWREARYRIVVDGNVLTFAAHPELRDFLLTTGERVLAEASPVDPVWGIGLAADDPRATDPSLWRGSNLLGFALMDVRERLRAAEA
jgi:ribA/ribD-fused uncharacterized protein